MKHSLFIAALCASCVTAANAQEALPQPITPPVMQPEIVLTVPAIVSAPIPAPVVSRMMPANTMLVVTPREEISSKKIEKGEKVQFLVVSDVLENGVVVIPRGATVTATIPWKTGRAIGGKSGKFDVEFNSVNVQGREYALHGEHRQEGRGNTVGALLGSIVISGRSAVMGPGQLVNIFTDEAIPY